MKTALIQKPWRHPFAVVLALALWGLLSSTSHAGTCKSRTVETESAPAKSYTVDATPIQEVITSHTASVVWTGCITSDYGIGEPAGTWISFFPLSLNVNAYHDTRLTKVNIVSDSVSEFYHSSASIRHGYYISCSIVGAKGFCLDKDEKNVDPPTNWPRDYGLRIYVETTWSAKDKDGRGCMLFATGHIGGGGSNVPDAGIATHQVIRLRSCTDVRLDLTLSIVKTKPFVVPNFDVATVKVTGTDQFKYRYCNYYKSCRTDTFLGGNFEVFNSGNPLTIKLSKTVRPLPPTRKCVVQLQSAPSRSRL
jgi:hypothetical protein